MSVLLAPYNDSMRLGMGFNSYTQTMCIDGAVKVTNENKVKVESPSQVVTYSSKFVERLSDIVSTMNISYSAAIKKGTIEVSGNGNTIDEDKIKASDINLVVSVQVINQTMTLKDTAEFQALEGVQPGSPTFNDAFGDCYISGFIEGGDFSSIISMRCLDRSKKNSVIRSIKKMAKTSTGPEEFTLDAYSLSDNISAANSLKETETTVTVNWMGGGQIKEPKKTWDIDAVYDAAASFPSFVAQTPQKTWAILTKYKANRSFNKWATSLSLRPLEYDNVISYTAELFNNFMEYKQLVKKVQDIIAHGDQYTQALKPKAIPIHIGTLVAVRSALRNEMNKIVTVVNLLSRKPDLLAKMESFEIVSKNDLVRQIVDEAISASPDSKIIHDSTSDKPAVASTPAPAAEKAPIETAKAPAEVTPSKDPKPPADTDARSGSSRDSIGSAGDFHEIHPSDVAQSPPVEKAKLAAPKPPEKPVELSKLADLSKPTELSKPSEKSVEASKPPEEPPQAPDSSSGDGVKIDLSALIAPEVWADLLPVRSGPISTDEEDPAAAAAAATMFPAPPKDDAISFLSSKNANELKILTAVCGIQDITQTLQDRVKDGVTLTIPINEIDSMAQSPVYGTLSNSFVKNLSFIYQYGDGPMRICSSNFNKNSMESINVTAQSQQTEVKARPWAKDSLSLVSIVYGGKVFNDEGYLKKVEDMVRQSFNGGPQGAHIAPLSNDVMGEDPLPGVSKTGVIFFKSTEKGPVRAAVALETKDCSLTDQPQLAELVKEVPKEVVKEVTKEVIKEVPKEVIKEVPREVVKEVVKEVPRDQITLASGLTCTRLSCTFYNDGLSLETSDDPFLKFEDGTEFKFQNDGQFVVYDSSGSCLWSAVRNLEEGDDNDHRLVFQQDGNAVVYGTHGPMWATGTDNRGARFVLSNTEPYVEVFDGSNNRSWASE